MEDFDYGPDIYTLIDEESGNEYQFELLDTLEENGRRYFALMPSYESPEDSMEDDGELVILQSEMIDDEEMMVSIDDDEEYERIGNIFLERLSELMWDEDENEDEEGNSNTQSE